MVVAGVPKQRNGAGECKHRDRIESQEIWHVSGDDSRQGDNEQTSSFEAHEVVVEMHPGGHHAYNQRDFDVSVVLCFRRSVVNTALIQISKPYSIELASAEGNEGGHFNHPTHHMEESHSSYIP